MSKKAKNDDTDTNDDISDWFKVTDPAFLELLKPGDILEFQETGYKHFGIFVGEQTGAGTSEEEGVGNIVHLSKEKNGIRLENLATLNEEWVRKNNSADSKYEALEEDEIVKKALHAVDMEGVYSLGSFNCEHFANSCRYGIPVSHQVDKIKDAILDSPPASLSPSSKFVSGLVAEYVTTTPEVLKDTTEEDSEEVLEETTEEESEKVLDDTTEEDSEEVMKFSDLLSEAKKTSKIDTDTQNILNKLEKLGSTVDKKYCDIRKSPLNDEEREIIEKVLQFKTIIIGHHKNYMKDKKKRKLFDVEELDDTTKKVLLVLILTLVESRSIREWGGEEKVADILHLASMLVFSTLRWERYNKDKMKNEDLDVLYNIIKKNLS